MEVLLDCESLQYETRKFTNAELLDIRQKLDQAVWERVNKRQYMMDRNISRVMCKYIKSLIEEAGFSDILGQDIWMWYCPSFKGQNYKDSTPPCVQYPERMGISFRYGESIKAKRFENDEKEKTFENVYSIRAELKYDEDRELPRISLIPPIHHVKSPPYTPFSAVSIANEAGIQWRLGNVDVPKDKKCSIPGCIIKSKLTTTAKRREIYGKELLDAFVDFYITRGVAVRVLRMCADISRRYQKHFIAGAQSATLCFLMVGRFHTKNLTCLSAEDQDQWKMKIPNDVVVYIAKIIWESRYDNQAWGAKTNPNGFDDIPPVVPPDVQKGSWYDEDHYSGYTAPHGWAPWFGKKTYLDVY